MSRARQLITAEGLAAVPYHYAAAASGRLLVFSAGACPLDGEGRIVHEGNVTRQTAQALANLAVVLEAAGCTRADVVKTTVFVASSARADLLAAWGEYERVFGTDGPPSTLLGVAALGWPGQLVEIEAIAAGGEIPEPAWHPRWAARSPSPPDVRAPFTD